MLRLLVSPKWIAWHVFTLGAMVSCGFLSAWQWHRAGSALGSALNIGYGVQWPIFAVFFAFMWWHFLRMELRDVRSTEAGDVTPAHPAGQAVVSTENASPGEGFCADRSGDGSGGPAPEPTAAEPQAARPPIADHRPSPFTPRPAGVEPSRLSDPQIRAYNEALAELAAEEQE